MERSLLFSALGIAALCVVCGGLLAQAGRPRPSSDVRGGPSVPRSSLLAAVLLPFLVFLATLPAKAPFAAGQGFGRGFLIGGLFALLAAVLVFRAVPDSADPSMPPVSPLAAAPPLALAVFAATIPLLFLRPVLEDALLGVAIGWLATTLTLIGGVRGQGSGVRGQLAPDGSVSDLQVTRSGPRPLTPDPFLASGIGYAVTVCLLALLSEYRGTLRFSLTQTTGWSGFAMLFAAAVPFALLLANVPAAITGRTGNVPGTSLFYRLLSPFVQSEEARETAAQVGRALFGTLLLLIMAKFLTLHVVTHPRLFLVLAIGPVMGLLAWWIVAQSGRQETGDERRETSAWQTSALAFFVVLAGTMVAYQAYAGVGVGLALVGAWLPLGFALRGDKGHEGGIEETNPYTLLRVLLFGAMLLVYRTFAARFGTELRGSNLTDFYALFGILIGALLPSLLGSWLTRSHASRIPHPASLLRLAATGAAVLIVPGVVLLLWGAKCAQTMMIGLTVGVVIGEGEIWGALIAVAGGLALAQWAHHVLLWAQLSRTAKIHALGWSTCILVLLIVIADYGGRVLSLRNASNNGALPGTGANGREGGTR